MSIVSYMYNLNNGQTYSYTRAVETSVSSAALSCSASSASSAYGSNVTYETIIIGSTNSLTCGTSSVNTASSTGSVGTRNSAGSASSIGSIETLKLGTVGALSFNQIISLFISGNLTVSETLSGLRAKGAKITGNSEVLNLYVIKFTYNSKNYVIKCNTKAAESQIDNRTSEVFNKNYLLGTECNFTESQINKYFNAVQSENGVNTKYVLKDSYKNLNQVHNAIKEEFEKYQKDLILDNFMLDMNRITDKSLDLKRTEDNKILTKKNYETYASEIDLATGEEAEKLRKEALTKLINDFTMGNLANTQVRTILNAIGITKIDYSTKNGAYTYEFDYDGKSYKISCNKATAEKGSDEIRVITYSESSLNKTGFTQNEISRLFTKIDNNSEDCLYIPKDGKTIEEVLSSVLSDIKNINYTTLLNDIGKKLCFREDLISQLTEIDPSIEESFKNQDSSSVDWDTTLIKINSYISSWAEIYKEELKTSLGATYNETLFEHIMQYAIETAKSKILESTQVTYSPSVMIEIQRQCFLNAYFPEKKDDIGFLTSTPGEFSFTTIMNQLQYITREDGTYMDYNQWAYGDTNNSLLLSKWELIQKVKDRIDERGEGAFNSYIDQVDYYTKPKVLKQYLNGEINGPDNKKIEYTNYTILPGQDACIGITYGMYPVYAIDKYEREYIAKYESKPAYSLCQLEMFNIFCNTLQDSVAPMIKSLETKFNSLKYWSDIQTEGTQINTMVLDSIKLYDPEATSVQEYSDLIRDVMSDCDYFGPEYICTALTYQLTNNITTKKEELRALQKRDLEVCLEAFIPAFSRASYKGAKISLSTIKENITYHDYNDTWQRTGQIETMVEFIRTFLYDSLSHKYSATEFNEMLIEGIYSDDLGKMLKDTNLASCVTPDGGIDSHTLSKLAEQWLNNNFEDIVNGKKSSALTSLINNRKYSSTDDKYQEINNIKSNTASFCAEYFEEKSRKTLKVKVFDENSTLYTQVLDTIKTHYPSQNITSLDDYAYLLENIADNMNPKNEENFVPMLKMALEKGLQDDINNAIQDLQYHNREITDQIIEYLTYNETISLSSFENFAIETKLNYSNYKISLALFINFMMKFYGEGQDCITFMEKLEQGITKNELYEMASGDAVGHRWSPTTTRSASVQDIPWVVGWADEQSRLPFSKGNYAEISAISDEQAEAISHMILNNPYSKIHYSSHEKNAFKNWIINICNIIGDSSFIQNINLMNEDAIHALSSLFTGNFSFENLKKACKIFQQGEIFSKALAVELSASNLYHATIGVLEFGTSIFTLGTCDKIVGAVDASVTMLNMEFQMEYNKDEYGAQFKQCWEGIESLQDCSNETAAEIRAGLEIVMAATSTAIPGLTVSAFNKMLTKLTPKQFSEVLNKGIEALKYFKECPDVENFGELLNMLSSTIQMFYNIFLNKTDTSTNQTPGLEDFTIPENFTQAGLAVDPKDLIDMSRLVSLPSMSTIQFDNSGYYEVPSGYNPMSSSIPNMTLPIGTLNEPNIELQIPDINLNLNFNINNDSIIELGSEEIYEKPKKPDLSEIKKMYKDGDIAEQIYNEAMQRFEMEMQHINIQIKESYNEIISKFNEDLENASKDNKTVVIYHNPEQQINEYGDTIVVKNYCSYKICASEN